MRRRRKTRGKSGGDERTSAVKGRIVQPLGDAADSKLRDYVQYEGKRK